ncbi:MAG: proline--tRNA ligase, partial [Candidatus Diapherotrites archaeon]|nr:proline--tRNA ligase [Candidatus Diapherotrites archaeon]
MPEVEKQQGITVKKEQDFSEWYNQIVLRAELADYAPVRGFMIVRPAAYQIWEKIQGFFNKAIEMHGVKNAYFPLLIPKSFFEKEAEHAAGFEPELAWVEEGKQDAEEKVAIRPTSETIIYDSYAKWIRSWRDLPLRLNQWCNVLRWEVKQCKLFLRTREFLWQEGHCVYTTEQECEKEALAYLDEYKKLCEELLAIPVIPGEKTESERFAGAKRTFTIEALMPDGKALQMGTSHNLGQGFAKVFGISYLDEKGQKQLPWQNSWGFSTRLIGALVMVHADNKGLVLPPNVAANKIVIVPIIFDKTREKVLKKAKRLSKKLSKFSPILDDRDGYSAGWKFNEWELKGIPLRVEVGPKDIAKKQAVLVRRDSGKKLIVKEGQLAKKAEALLKDMQAGLFSNAGQFLKKNTLEVKSWADFKNALESKKLILAHFCNAPSCEEAIKG